MYKSLKRRFVSKIEEEDNEKPFTPKREVFRVGADIYFFDEIDAETHSLFLQAYEGAIKYIYDTSGEHAIKSRGEPSDVITIHFNSPGGDVFSSLAMYDYLKNAEIPAIGIVEGQAASGASIMMCGCQERLMTKHSMMLIHELSSLTYGKLSKMKQDFENWEKMMELIKDIYRENTKIPEDELDKILEPDYYWKAEKCKEYGLVTGIIGEEEPPSKEELETSIKTLETILETQKKALADLNPKSALTKKTASKKKEKPSTPMAGRKSTDKSAK